MSKRIVTIAEWKRLRSDIRLPKRRVPVYPSVPAALIAQAQGTNLVRPLR